jgi:hypothetical protein
MPNPMEMQLLKRKEEILDALASQDRSLPFQTNLSEPEQAGFADWAAKNKVPVDLSKGSDYDMPGFYKAMQKGSASSGVSPIDNQVHFTDQFKTPTHETFSNESQYSSGNDPHWEDNAQRDALGELAALELPGGEILKVKKGMR